MSLTGMAFVLPVLVVLGWGAYSFYLRAKWAAPPSSPPPDALGVYLNQRVVEMLEPAHWEKVVSGKVDSDRGLIWGGSVFYITHESLTVWWREPPELYVTYRDDCISRTVRRPMTPDVADWFKAEIKRAWPDMVPLARGARDEPHPEYVIRCAEKARHKETP